MRLMRITSYRLAVEPFLSLGVNDLLKGNLIGTRDYAGARVPRVPYQSES